MVIFVKSCVFTFWAEHRFFFFFSPQFDTSNGNQYLLLFHRAQLNYDKVKGRKDIMILLICVVTTLIELVLVANAF